MSKYLQANKGDIDMHQMRRAKPAEFWETHIKKWKETTNEPKSEYCKRHGLLETQFTYWINRVDTETECKMDALSLPDTSEKWINLSIDQPVPANETTRCELEFKNGTRLILQTDRGLSLLETLIPLIQC